MKFFVLSLPELVRLEMSADMQEIPEDTGGIHDQSCPECAVISEMLGQDSAEKDAEAESCIP